MAPWVRTLVPVLLLGVPPASDGGGSQGAAAPPDGREAGLVYRSPLGFQLTLPPGFAVRSDLPPGPSRAVAPAAEGVAVELLAAFQEGSGLSAASLAIAVAGAPLELDPAAPDRFAALAMAFVREALESDLHIEWVERVPIAAQGAGFRAVELAGRVEVEGQDRVAQFACIGLGDRQLVLTASLPANRFGSLGPAIERALGTLTVDHPHPLRPDPERRAAIGALLGALLGLAVAAGRWRRQRRLAGP